MDRVRQRMPRTDFGQLGSVADALYDRIAMRRGSLGRLVDADRGGSTCVIDPDAATAL